MDVQRLRHGDLAQKTGQPGHLRVRDAGGPVAFRMTRIVTQDGDRATRPPKAHQRDHRVDHADGFGAQRGAAGRGETHRAYLAVRAEEPAVGGNVVHRRLAEANFSDKFRGVDRGPDGAVEALQDCAGEVAPEPTGIQPGLHQYLFRREIGGRRVVVVQGVDGHAFGNGAGGGGQGGPERVVAFVGDAQPVDGAQHDGLSCSEQDDAAGAEAEIPRLDHAIVGHPGAGGRRGINVEGGDPNARRRVRGVGGVCHRPDAQEQQQQKRSFGGHGRRIVSGEAAGATKGRRRKGESTDQGKTKTRFMAETGG